MVVEAVRGGQLTLQEACERYQLSLDEFLSWERAIERHDGRRCQSRQTAAQQARRGEVDYGN